MLSDETVSGALIYTLKLLGLYKWFVYIIIADLHVSPDAVKDLYLPQNHVMKWYTWFKWPVESHIIIWLFVLNCLTQLETVPKIIVLVNLENGTVTIAW